MRGDRSLKRRVNIRQPKQKFTLLTEGGKTEPDYFRALERHLTGTLIHIEIIPAAGVPFTIAQQAGEMADQRRCQSSGRSSFEEADEIWAVFDRDDHPKVREACERCKRSKVEIAFSDPCFELWLILHHKDFDGPDDRHQVQDHLKEILPGYDPKKGKTTDFQNLMPLIGKAETRAEKQWHRRHQEGDPPSRPFTTVFRLTQRMRAAHERYQRPATT